MIVSDFFLDFALAIIFYVGSFHTHTPKHIYINFFFTQIWNLKPGWGSRPDLYIEKSHSDDITGLTFSGNGQTLLSRSFDGTLKVIEFNISVVMLNIVSHLSMQIHNALLSDFIILMNVPGLGSAPSESTS